MKRSFLRKFAIRLFTWGMVAVAGAVAVRAQGGAAQQRTDSQIEMDVVKALDGAAALKDDLITAATIQSAVTLSGTVAKEDSRKLAESIAAAVPGVSKVQNNLQVGNPQAAEQAENLQPVAEDASANSPVQQAEGPASDPNGYAQAAPSGPEPYSPEQATAPYPQQGGYPPNAQPYPQARAPYGYAQQPQRPAFRLAPGPLTVPQGTLLALRTSEPVDSKRAKPGEPVEFVVISDVNSGGYLAIPRGAVVHGVVTGVENTERGDLGGSAALGLRLTTLELGGISYPLQSEELKLKGPNKAGRTVGSAIGGALLGAMIGGVAGGGPGAAIGAGAGAGVGTAASAATQGPGVWIPAEARVDFHMLAPITVQPVGEQEAMRLMQGLYPGGPTLYRRPPAYYGRPVVYAYPYSPYPPVYYRPYAMVGGYYTWR